MNSKKISTLADFLNITTEEIQPDEYTGNLYITPEGEYLVLTDREARQAAEEYISTSLWAFNAEFILEACGLERSGEVIKSLQAMQNNCCENCNDFIRTLIDGTCGFDYFCDDAILADGRGHFIAFYDGEENELNNLYIYRVN